MRSTYQTRKKDAVYVAHTVKAGKLKRTPLKDERGSRYSLA